MVRASCRDVVLDAAEAVVFHSGAAHLTLEAVAEKAGVSKGGLLYHFPTKEVLLAAMMARLTERHERRRAAALEQLPPGPAREFQADLRAVLEKCGADTNTKMSAGLLAAVANEPSLLGAMRERYRQKFERYTESNGKLGRKALLLLAAHGLALTEMLQVSPFTPEQRETLHAEMMKLAEDFSHSD